MKKNCLRFIRWLGLWKLALNLALFVGLAQFVGLTQIVSPSYIYRYVISTLELLVAEDYMIVYFHGATPRRQMPSFNWLKRCYQMIDRRLV